MTFTAHPVMQAGSSDALQFKTSAAAAPTHERAHDVCSECYSRRDDARVDRDGCRDREGVAPSRRFADTKLCCLHREEDDGDNAAVRAAGCLQSANRRCMRLLDAGMRSTIVKLQRVPSPF